MNKLTENSIRKAKILEKQYKIYDGGGMFLLIHQNGSKYWRMKYTFDGKNKLASFGVWPSVKLSEARKKRNDAKKMLKMGINPVEGMREKKQQQKINSDEKVNSESVKVYVNSSKSSQWISILSSQGNMRETKESLNLLKLNIFGEVENNLKSLLDKQELNKILGNIISNRRNLFQIIMDLYLRFPILNLAVLFLILLYVMDFFPALLSIFVYFLITVCTAISFGLFTRDNVKEECLET